MSTPRRTPPDDWQHPVRRPDVLLLVEQWTRSNLAASGGTGRIVLEFDFHEWEAMQITPVVRGARVSLTHRKRLA